MKCLHLGTSHQQHDYYLGSTTIRSVLSVRDLGVTIDEDLKFHEHTLFVINKANHILGLIKRSFACLDCNMLVRLYKSMVRPILEYPFLPNRLRQFNVE